MRKRILSILLAAVLILGMLPASVFAAGPAKNALAVSLNGSTATFTATRTKNGSGENFAMFLRIIDGSNKVIAGPTPNKINASTWTSAGVKLTAGSTFKLQTKNNNGSDWSDGGATVTVYSVTYDPNGGTGSAVTDFSKSSAYTLRASDTFSNTGKTFAEWNTKADGTGTSYEAAGSFTAAVPANTLYAIWENAAVGSITVAKALEGGQPVADPVYGVGVTDKTFYTVTSANVGQLSVEWKQQNDSFAATAPTGITLTAAGVLTVGTSVDAGDYVFHITDGSTTSDPVTLTVAKATKPAPTAGVGYTLNYVEETMTADTGYEVSSTDGATATPLTNVTPGATYYVRALGDDNHNTSAWTANTLAARPTAPATTPAATATTATSITVTAAAGYEYSVDAGANWKDDADDGEADGKVVFSGLTAGTSYTVVSRIAASNTDPKCFASLAGSGASVTLPADPNAKITVVKKTVSATPVPDPVYGQAMNNANFYVITVDNSVPGNARVEWKQQDGSWSTTAPTGISLNVNNGKLSVAATVPAGNYVFRITNDKAHNAPNFVASSEVTLTVAKATKPTPAAGVGYTLDYVEETMTATTGYEVSSTDGATATPLTDNAVTPGATYYVRALGDDNHNPSGWTSVTLDTRPAAPSVAPVLDGKTVNSITVLSVAGYEYSLATGVWLDDAGDGNADGKVSFTGLTGGSYTVVARYKASNTAPKKFAGTAGPGLQVALKTGPAAAPMIADSDIIKDGHSVTLPTKGEPNLYEYSTDGVIFDSVNTIVGLPYGQEFVFWIRYKETDTALASLAAEVHVTLTGTTPSPTATPSVSPTATPSATPTVAPTATPTAIPTQKPKSSDCPHGADCPAKKYSDVNANSWMHDGIHYCTENGLMVGNDGKFDPNGKTTRAMVVSVLWRMAGSPVVNYQMTFKDVPAGQWYTEAVRWAAYKGICYGYSADKFGTEDTITREDLASMIYRYAGQPATTNYWKELLPFGDKAKVSEWAGKATFWCFNNGLISGKDGNKFDPKGTATRAEVASIIQRYCEK